MHNPAVRKPRRILLITLLIAAVGFVSWLIVCQPSEPIYQGKPLTFWCEQYADNFYPDSDNELKKQAELAIRTIGTNAVPTLLRMLKAKDSKFKLRLIELASKQHLINIKWKMAEFRHGEALQGLLALGPQAKSALPTLLELYGDYEHHRYVNYKDRTIGYVYSTIAQIFASIGPEAVDAVPLLVQETTDSRSDVRLNAVFALRQIHARPNLVVPTLTKSLRDSTDVVRSIAASSLAVFGSDAKSAVPELIKALADPSPAVREQAASALKEIDPEAAAKAGVK